MIALAVLARAAGVPASSQVAVLLGSDSPYYREALEGFEEELGGKFQAAVAPARPSGWRDATVVVAFGGKAALQEADIRAPLVYCMAPGIRLDAPRGRVRVRVAMTPPPAALAARLKVIQPGLRRLVVFWLAEAMEVPLREFRQAAGAAGVQVVAVRLDRVDDLPSRLRALDVKPDAVWLPPDPLLVTAESFAVLREYAWANGVPLYAPTAGLAEQGAAVSLAADYREIGRAAGRATRALVTGGEVADVAYPDKIDTALNLTAAARSGLELSRSIVASADRVFP